MDLKKFAIRRRQLDKEHVRYFELTNMAQLTEEVGEVARICPSLREQSEKESDKIRTLAKN
jgi:NTP pyrophosphatase (non-canonical NTP hydrolase)